MKSTGRFKKYVLQAAMLAACAATGDVTLSENVALDADADWRDQGTVTIGAGVTLDLNGHALRVAAIAGEGRIAVSVTIEFARDGFGTRVCYRMDDVESGWLELSGDGTVHGVGVCGNLHSLRGAYEDLSSRGLIIRLANK